MNVRFLACTAALLSCLLLGLGCAGGGGNRPTQSQCDQTNELAQLACVTAWPHGGDDYDSCVRVATAVHLACQIAAMPADPAPPAGVSALSAGPTYSARDAAAQRWADLLDELIDGRIPPGEFRNLVGP